MYRRPLRRGGTGAPIGRALLATVAILCAACSREEGGGADDVLSNEALAPLLKPWKGDLDGMIERRYIRVLTVNSPVLYFVDRGRQRGVVFEMARRFEDYLNKKLEKRHVRVHVVILPVGRDEVLPRLAGGQGDLAMAQLTITPEREAVVDFSIPVIRDVSEILVTGPGSKPIRTIDDLAGREVYVRKSSSYAEHLANLNRDFRERGLAPVKIQPTDELLEVGDILEMVNAGLVPATIVDNSLAELYAQVLGKLKIHGDIAINSGGQIAWAFRKNSPELAAMVNNFLKTSRQGTLVGNVLLKRYLKDTQWVDNAQDRKSLKRYRSMVNLFRKYGERYGLDPLLLMAQAYQESRLDNSKRSRAGAVGVMQMLPSTANDKNVGMPDIAGLEDNIHAGAKYMKWMMDRYYDDPGMTGIQRELFALASYNAGPAKVARLRKEAAARGLDPDRWFDNVEVVAAGKIGRETVQYVANVYKYYLAYVTLEAREEARNEAKEKALGG